jgi:ureidoacrylate peracid hydrolase
MQPHKYVLHEHVRQRIERRRGKLHVYDRIEAPRTALLVVDMQDGFCKPGEASEVPVSRAIVPNINRLAASLRAAGGTVVWISSEFTPEDIRGWSAFFDNFYSPDRRDRVMRSLEPGGSGAPLWKELDVQKNDWTCIKKRFSALIQGASDLEPRLRQAGIDTVLVTGTVTNVCCESTARDAAMRNFKVVMVSDGNAAHSDEDHNNALGALFQVFADVMTTDEVIARLAAQPAKAASGD